MIITRSASTPTCLSAGPLAQGWLESLLASPSDRWSATLSNLSQEHRGQAGLFYTGGKPPVSDISLLANTLVAHPPSLCLGDESAATQFLYIKFPMVSIYQRHPATLAPTTLKLSNRNPYKPETSCKLPVLLAFSVQPA